MCVLDAATKAAAVAGFLREFPRAADAGRDHPALRGCADVAWSEIPECPTGIPELFFAQLDPVAAAEAGHVLTNVLMHSPFAVSAVMPAALPFLMRLAVAPDVTVRSTPVDLVWVTAMFCEPVQADGPGRCFGAAPGDPHLDRCRAVFAAHPDLVAALLGDDLTREQFTGEVGAVLRGLVVTA